MTSPLHLDLFFLAGDSRLRSGRGERQSWGAPGSVSAAAEAAAARRCRLGDRSDVRRLRPFEPSRSSYSTGAPSARLLKPSPAMLLWCTKRSFVPWSGVMNPYPLLSLNHLTVPLAMKKHLPYRRQERVRKAQRANRTRSGFRLQHTSPDDDGHLALGGLRLVPSRAPSGADPPQIRQRSGRRAREDSRHARGRRPDGGRRQFCARVPAPMPRRTLPAEARPGAI
jgi:hypothetical protein